MDGLDGNALFKAFALSMEGKMAAEAFGDASNHGWDGSFNLSELPSSKTHRCFIKVLVVDIIQERLCQCVSYLLWSHYLFVT